MQTNPPDNNVSLPIERLATFIRNLPQQDKVKLVKLVPELQTIPSEITSISQKQTALMGFFDQFTDSTMPSLPENGLFFKNVTFFEFFNLPDEDQALIWQDAHTATNITDDNIEQEVRPDAIPAG